MTSPLDTFHQASARILDGNGQVVGGGVRVSSQHVLTCARVLADLAGPVAEVSIHLPFMGPATYAARAVPTSWPELVLLILHAPLVRGSPACIARAGADSGSRFTAWVPQAGAGPELLRVTGGLREAAPGHPVADLDTLTTTDLRCSGVAAADPASDEVLGLLLGRGPDAAWEVIPAQHLRAALHEAGVVAQEPSLQALAAWARDRYAFRWPLRAAVLQLIASYQGRPDEPRAFAGRAALMDELDQWLLQREDRLRLLSGAAGRGKSALQLHWLERLIARNSPVTIVYLPISIRFGTADEAAGLQLLCAALCDVVSELQQRIPQQPELEDYLRGITWAWEQLALRRTEAFLLVVDGLDEAIHAWLVERRLLPTPLPANLHVLISARHKPGHTDGSAWLRDLGCTTIEAASLGRQVLELHSLAPGAMAEAVMQLGVPLAHLPDPQAFLEQLHRLTDGGDPLLLTLWLGEIWRKREELPEVSVRALAGLQPGFADFYQLWISEQQQLWSAQGLRIRTDDVSQLLQVLALAQGPLPLSDLLEVLSHLAPGRWEGRDLGAVLATAQRLVLAEAAGYVLVHPRMAHYLRERLDQDPPRRQGIESAFLSWGADTVCKLNSGELEPHACPAYLLTHYVGVHIQAAGTDGHPAPLERYLALLRPGWARAWHSREGAWHGFLNDLRQVLEVLHAANRRCVQAGRPTELRLAAEARGALLAAGIRSMSESLPEELLLALARESVWSLERAARVARHYHHWPNVQVRVLGKLATIAAQRQERAQARSLWQEILAMVARQDDAFSRRSLGLHCSTALLELVGQLQKDRAQWSWAVEVAAAIPHHGDRAQALGTLATVLQAEPRLLARALESVVSIDTEDVRARALSTMAPALGGHPNLLQHALEAAVAMEDVHDRAKVLAALAEAHRGDEAHWPRMLEAIAAQLNEHCRAAGLCGLAASSARHPMGLPPLLEMAAALADEQGRAVALCALAAAAEADSAVLAQVLEMAAGLADPECRASVLGAVALRHPGPKRRTLLLQALHAAADMGNPAQRAATLLGLAKPLPEEDRPPALEKVLQSARKIKDERVRVDALLALASELRGDARQDVLREALQAAQAIGYLDYRAASLSAVSAQLQGEDARRALQQAVEAALEAACAATCPTRGLLMVAAELAGDAQRTVLDYTLRNGASIQDESAVPFALAEVGGQLSGAARHTVLQRALAEAASEQDYAGDRAIALSYVAAQLQGEAKEAVLHQALEAAHASGSARAAALLAVSAQLQGDAKHRALQEAAAAAASIQDGLAEARALVGMARGLPNDAQAQNEVLRQAQEAARAIRDGSDRVAALLELARLEPTGESAQALQHLWVGEAQEAAEAIRDPEDRAAALAAIAMCLHGDARRAAVQRAIDMAQTLEPKWMRCRALDTVMSRLHGDDTLLRQGLAAASTDPKQWGEPLEDQWEERESLLTCVAGQLLPGSALAPQVLGLAASIPQGLRGRCLLALAPALQEERLLQQALQWATAIEDEEHRAKVLLALANALGQQLRPDSPLPQQLMEMAAQIRQARPRVSVLAAVAAIFEGKEGKLRHTALWQALDAAQAIPHEHHRALALRQIAAHLQPQGELLQRALEVTAGIQRDSDRALALSGIAVELQADRALLRRVLEAAPAILREPSTVQAIGTVLAGAAELSLLVQPTLEVVAAFEAHPYAAPSTATAFGTLSAPFSAPWQAALETAAQIRCEMTRTRALIGLAAALAGEAQRAVLQQALLPSKGRQGAALSSLAPHLSPYPQLQALCLESALALPASDETRMPLAFGLVAQNPSLLTYEAWRAFLDGARINRPRLLDVLSDLARWAVELTGRPEEALEMARAIREICAAFP